MNDKGTSLPRSDDMFDRLGDDSVLSKVDLKFGFFEMRVPLFIRL